MWGSVGYSLSSHTTAKYSDISLQWAVYQSLIILLFISTVKGKYSDRHTVSSTKSILDSSFKNYIATKNTKLGFIGWFEYIEGIIFMKRRTMDHFCGAQHARCVELGIIWCHLKYVVGWWPIISSVMYCI